MLAATNGAVLGIALWQEWPLVVLLWPYWLQSLIIGWYSRRRILALQDFSLANTGGFDAGSPEATRRKTAKSFGLHYGFFHLLYFIFLLAATFGRVNGVAETNLTPLDAAFLGVLGVSFVITHRASYARIMASDRRGRPNIGQVMFLPYLRILPMHLAILFGLGLAQGSAWGVLLFGVLKTLADLAMHYIEYRITMPKLQSPA
jgi:hypothetical protein